MEEQIVSFETAKLAKEKKFNWKCRGKIHCSHEHFVKKNVIPSNVNTYHKNMFAPIENHNRTFQDGTQTYTSLPTQSLLQKWLREVHNIHIIVFLNSEKQYFSDVYQNFQLPVDSGELDSLLSGRVYISYEDALEAALQEALNLI